MSLLLASLVCAPLACVLLRLCRLCLSAAVLCALAETTLSSLLVLARGTVGHTGQCSEQQRGSGEGSSATHMQARTTDTQDRRQRGARAWSPPSDARDSRGEGEAKEGTRISKHRRTERAGYASACQPKHSMYSRVRVTVESGRGSRMRLQFRWQSAAQRYLTSPPYDRGLAPVKAMKYL